MYNETRKCQKCGNDLIKRKDETTRVYNSRKYCSLPCYRSGSRPNRKTGIEKKCDYCQKDIYVSKKMIRGVNFCSAECHNAYQGRNKLIYSCKICNSQFKLSKSIALLGNPTYCSIKCRNLCADWKLNACIKGNLKLQNSKNATKLEIAGYKILDEIGYSYQKQHPIENKFTVDAFITEFKLVIQFDGDYWHGFKKDKNGNLDKRQQRRIDLDKSQDAYMKKLDYKILRFWEHEIHKEKQNVIDLITKIITKLK